MYSYHGGSSGGGFRRGHGGQNYRPPAERRDKTKTPPPIKECVCLVEITIDEYSDKSSPQPRVHQCFGGRSAMESCKKKCREMRVHLVVPGRNQAGPISIVAGSYQDALPAMKWLIDTMSMSMSVADAVGGDNETLKGRIIFDVVKGMHDAKVGDFHTSRSRTHQHEHEHVGSQSQSQRQSLPQREPRWLFHSSNQNWSILTCAFTSNESSQPNQNHNNNHLQTQTHKHAHSLSSLMTCFDNVIFCEGSNSSKAGTSTRQSSNPSSSVRQLEYLMNQEQKFLFAFGSLQSANLLFKEIMKIT